MARKHPKRKIGGKKKIPKKLVMKTVVREKGHIKPDTMATQMPRSNAPVFKIKVKKKKQ